MKNKVLRICIVEDNVNQYQMFSKILERAPFENVHINYTNGDELLSKNIENDFDLLLLDYKLPGKNGNEIIREIKSRHINIPIILISAYESENIIAEALELGADDYIIKDTNNNYLKVLNSVIKKTIKRFELEQENIQLQREMLYTQKMQSLSNLARGIAHDFNNALVGIIGYVDILKLKFPKDEETLLFLDRVYSSAKRMSTWVKQLLAYSKSEFHSLIPTNINIVIQRSVQIITPLLEKRIKIFTSLDQNLNKVEADKIQIEQAITNILMNCIESITAEGEIKITTQNVTDVYLKDFIQKKKVSKEYVEIVIEDNGIGMDKETLEKVFEPFFTTKFIGRGLGMAAVYGIIDNHYGHIKINSEPQKGTKFEIFLPCSENEEIEEKNIESKGFKEKILIVDDESITLEVIKRLFKDEGFKILEARDGYEAIEVYKSNTNISLVILDLILPSKSGLEVLNEIKSINPEQKIIICTGYDTDIGEDLIKLGISGVIKKPFSIQEIIECVKSTLDLK